MKSIITALLTFTSLVSFSQQQENPITFQLSGGIKRTIFKNNFFQMSAYNVSPSFNTDDIKPKISNTLSFFTYLKSNKALSKKWSISNTLGLDMQQLSIISGLKKGHTTPNITSYTNTQYTDLLTRMKVDFGLNYKLFSGSTNFLSLGLSAGEMIALSKEANTYSFLEGNLNYTKNQFSVFMSGSLTPYNVKLKNFERYVGNKGAEAVDAQFEYRIYEISLGLAYKL